MTTLHKGAFNETKKTRQQMVEASERTSHQTQPDPKGRCAKDWRFLANVDQLGTPQQCSFRSMPCSFRTRIFRNLGKIGTTRLSCFPSQSYNAEAVTLRVICNATRPYATFPQGRETVSFAALSPWPKSNRVKAKTGITWSASRRRELRVFCQEAVSRATGQVVDPDNAAYATVQHSEPFRASQKKHSPKFDPSSTRTQYQWQKRRIPQFLRREVVGKAAFVSAPQFMRSNPTP